MSVTELPQPRHYGPNAFGDDLRRFWNLTFTLAVTDYKLTYFGSVLGYVWSLMRPLLFFGVLYGVFTFIFHVGKGRPQLQRRAAHRDHPLDLLPTGDGGLRPVHARPRGDAAQDALPAPGDPARGDADRALPGRDEPGTDLRARPRLEHHAAGGRGSS